MEKTIKKKVLVVLLVVLMALVVGAVACTLFVRQGKVWAEQDKSDAERYGWYLDSLIETKDIVVGQLTLEETRKFKDYTPDDFIEIGALSVDVMFPKIDEFVRRKIQGLPIEIEFDENVETYKRRLKITLNKKSKKNLIRAIDILSARSDMDYVRPYIVGGVASIDANDTYSSDQWGIENANIDKAWEKIHDGEPVIVGVLDSGIDASHPDLTDKIYRERTHNIGTTWHRDFTTGETNGTPVLDPTDMNGHGTHVAGIIAAERDNDAGVAGVANNVKLVSLKVIDDNGHMDDVNTLINAIKYAQGKGIRLLNFSGRIEEEGANSYLENAINQYNGIFVTAAGNGSTNLDSDPTYYPAAYDLENIITVGAIDEQNERLKESNWGETTVDIFAPGSGIYSTYSTMLCNMGKCKRDEHKANGYHSMSGTSMAAPFVTGTAALMLSLNPDLTVAEVKAGILNGADQINIHNVAGDELTVKKLNAYAAIRETAVYETQVLSDTEVKILGAFDKTLSGLVVLPDTLRDRNVVSIGNEAFANQTELTVITLPSELQSVGYKAFYGCANMIDVIFGKNVSYIGARAFSFCNNLRFYGPSINPNYIFGGSILYNKDKTAIVATGGISENITIDSPITEIMPYAFEGNTNLQTVRFDTDVYIGDGAFANCNNLTELYFTTQTSSRAGTNILFNIEPSIRVPFYARSDYEFNFEQYTHLIYTKTKLVKFYNGTEVIEERVVDCDSPITNLPELTSTGYIFGGWYDYKGKKYSEGNIWTDEPSTILYAKWFPIQCTVKFVTDYGFIYGQTEMHVNYGETFSTNTRAEREGFVFDGWQDDSGFGCINAQGESTIIWNRIEETVLTPKWYRECYEIRINDDDVLVWVVTDGISETQDLIEYGTSVPGGDLKELFGGSSFGYREGYIFDYLQNEDREFNLSIIPDLGENNAVVSILPIWRKEQHTIIFRMIGDTYEKNWYYGEDISLPAMSRTGYFFGGWYFDEACTEKVNWVKMPDLTPGQEGNGSVMIYDKWIPYTYYIAFDKNGGNGTMASIKCLYGEEYTLPKNSFTKEDYKFTGWALNINDGVSFLDGVVVKNLCKSNNGVVMLHAIWKIYRYKIYCKNLASSLTVDRDYYIVGEGLTTMPRLISKDAYGYVSHFYGWYTSSSFNTQVTSIPKTSTGSVTIYAKYDYFVCSGVKNGTFTVTDDGVASNPTAALDVNFRTKHYNNVKGTTSFMKIRITFSFRLWEINDGYQHIYLRTDINGGNIWSTKLDHPSSKNGDEYSFTIELNLETYKNYDNLLLCFDASGAGRDDWQFAHFMYKVELFK